MRSFRFVLGVTKVFCLETDSCKAVSRCFTSVEPKTLSCARSLAQEKDRVLRALFFTFNETQNCFNNAMFAATILKIGQQPEQNQTATGMKLGSIRNRLGVGLECYCHGTRL